MSNLKKGDVVRTTFTLGPFAQEEGTIVSFSTINGTEVVYLEMAKHDGELHFFRTDTVELVDPAPVEEPKAPTVNKILNEWLSDAERMLILQTDLLGYGMKDSAAALDKEAGVVLKFTQALRWALKKDGLYIEED